MRKEYQKTGDFKKVVDTVEKMDDYDMMISGGSPPRNGSSAKKWLVISTNRLSIPLSQTNRDPENNF